MQMLPPGVHRIRAKSASGVAEYWYAWRKGPNILTAKAKNPAALKREIARLMPAALREYERRTSPGEDSKFLSGLIRRYLESGEFGKLAERTQRDRRKTLDRARADLGHMELRSLEARGARKELLDWRGEFAKTPRTADALLTDLSTALNWGVDNDHIHTNPVKEFTRLYQVDRAAIIWTPEDLEKLLPKCAKELRWAVLLAIHTGARLGDLRALTWAAVGEKAMTWQTGKSNRKRTVVVPITPSLKSALDEIERRGDVILTSARKRPWTEPGLETALRKAKIEAGVSGLRWHDMRGTAATNLIAFGSDLADVATILGWSSAKVSEIARRYVSSEAMAAAMLDRMERARAEREAVKSWVKSDPAEPDNKG